MRCKDCGFANGEEDHRCLLCGRRLAGVVIAAPVGYSGANALAMAPMYDPRANETQEFTLSPPPSRTSRPLGTDRNVIPFDEIRQRIAGRAATAPPATPTPAPQAPVFARPVFASPVFAAPVFATNVFATNDTNTKPAPPRTTRRAAAISPDQGSLDFVHATPAPRTLANHVPAQIFCEQAVATPQHRLVASAIDAAMVLLGFGTFALVLELSGASLGSGNTFRLMLGLTFGLISLFYGLIWVIAGRETAGMSMTDLQLITFDGFPVDPKSRAIRFASTWLSFLSGGLGLIWALADEESLTWHDQISKTFPTFKEVPLNFVKQRRR